jgi:glycerol kinase
MYEIHNCNKLLNSKNRVFIDSSILKNKDNFKNTRTQKALFADGNNNFNIENFTQIYLSKLFSKDTNEQEEHSEWLKENTEETFFTEYLIQEIEARSQNKINSEFQINKIYTENIDDIFIKAICFGRETFTDIENSSRNLIIEILINTKTQKLEKILSIKEN